MKLQEQTVELNSRSKIIEELKYNLTLLIEKYNELKTAYNSLEKKKSTKKFIVFDDFCIRRLESFSIKKNSIRKNHIFEKIFEISLFFEKAFDLTEHNNKILSENNKIVENLNAEKREMEKNLIKYDEEVKIKDGELDRKEKIIEEIQNELKLKDKVLIQKNSEVLDCLNKNEKLTQEIDKLKNETNSLSEKLSDASLNSNFNIQGKRNIIFMLKRESTFTILSTSSINKQKPNINLEKINKLVHSFYENTYKQERNIETQIIQNELKLNNLIKKISKIKQENQTININNTILIQNLQQTNQSYLIQINELKHKEDILNQKLLKKDKESTKFKETLMSSLDKYNSLQKQYIKSKQENIQLKSELDILTNELNDTRTNLLKINSLNEFKINEIQKKLEQYQIENKAKSKIIEERNLEIKQLKHKHQN